MRAATLSILVAFLVWAHGEEQTSNELVREATAKLDTYVDTLVEKLVMHLHHADLGNATLGKLVRHTAQVATDRPCRPMCLQLQSLMVRRRIPCGSSWVTLGGRLPSGSGCVRWQREHGSMVLRRALSWEATPQAGVYEALVPKLWKGERSVSDDPSPLVRFDHMISDEVLEKARELVPRLRLNLDLDTVDNYPTFEVPWVRNGAYTHKGLADVFRETVDTKLIPAIKSSRLVPEGTDIALCSALLRVYDEGQRRMHPAHYDAHAYITAIFELDASSQGGFYLQPGAHAESRLPVAMDPGAVYAHSYDLMHGVDVPAGRRVSVIFWFADSVASCRKVAQPWYEARADAGQPESQHNLGQQLIAKGFVARGTALLESAAGQGHFLAQNELGTMAIDGTLDGKQDLAAAERWYNESAAQGNQYGMVGMARVCTERGKPDEALKWMRRAAEQRANPNVQFMLGKFLIEGLPGVSDKQYINVEDGCGWLRQACEMGMPDAQVMIGKQKNLDTEERKKWLKLAAAQGNKDAQDQLDWLNVEAGDLSGISRAAGNFFKGLPR